MFKISIPHLVLLAAICFLVIVPFFWLGNPSGHDFEFHMFSWMEVLQQWKEGIIYPRWASQEHWGYGEARFIFYPPASWTLGAALGAFLPWWAVPGAYIWIALFLAAVSMFHLARSWLPSRDALFAAALYAINPYHLVIIYWRSAFAELLASVVLPLLLLWTIRLAERSIRPVLWLSLVLAGAWLANAPAAVMVHYSLAAIAVVMAVLNRSWLPLLKVAMAVLIGAGLASFYLLPAAYEEKWVNIGDVLSPGVRPQDNFLFTTFPDPDHNRFNLLVSVVASAEIVVAVTVLWFSRGWRKKQRELWTLASAWAAVSIVIMFSISNILWQHLPKLRFVQIPWRWLLCLNAALAMLLTLAFSRWSVRALVAIALIALVVVAGYRIQPPWWDNAADIREMATAMSDGTGNEGTDEYVPIGADASELKKELPRVVVCGAGIPARDCTCGVVAAHDCTDPRSHILQWTAQEKHFVVDSTAAENLLVRLFNYPAWEVTVNGNPVHTETTEVTGQMVIPIQAGRKDVRIRFRRTLDRTLGDAVSVAGLALFLGFWRKSRTPPASNLRPHLK